MNCRFSASAGGALRSGDARPGRWRARLDRLKHLNESFLVPVAKKRGVEVGALRGHDMFGERLHILVDLLVGDVAEDVGRVASLAGLARRHAKQAVVPRLEHYDAFALGQDNAAERCHVLRAHGRADDGERLLPDLVFDQHVGVLGDLVSLRLVCSVNWLARALINEPLATYHATGNPIFL